MAQEDVVQTNDEKEFGDAFGESVGDTGKPATDDEAGKASGLDEEASSKAKGEEKPGEDKAPDEFEAGAAAEESTTDNDAAAEAAARDIDGGEPGKGEELPGEEELSDKEKRQEASWKGRLNKREGELDKRSGKLDEQETRLSSLLDKLEGKADSNKAGEPSEAHTEDLDSDTGDEDLDEELQSFMDDYPHLASSVQKLIGKAVDKVAESVKPVVAKADADAERAETEVHFGEIRKVHADFDKLVDPEKNPDFQVWVNEQPSYVVDKLKEVCSDGTPEQVIEMVTDYKKARKLDTATEDKDIDGDKGGNKETDSRLDDAEAVRSDRGEAPRSKDQAEDFDGAFEEATVKR